MVELDRPSCRQGRLYRPWGGQGGVKPYESKRLHVHHSWNYPADARHRPPAMGLFPSLRSSACATAGAPQIDPGGALLAPAVGGSSTACTRTITETDTFTSLPPLATSIAIPRPASGAKRGSTGAKRVGGCTLSTWPWDRVDKSSTRVK